MFNTAQWINWQPLQVESEPKPRKVPSDGVTPITYQVQHVPGQAKPNIKIFNAIDHTSPANHVDYSTASARNSLKGFVFTANDPYTFIDLDNCLTPDGWSPIAKAVCAMFPGAFIEVSQSGVGLHVITTAKLQPGFKHTNKTLGLEIYDQGRYAAITCISATGDTNINHQQAVDLFCQTYMEPAVIADLSNWTTTPRFDWAGPDDDDELIKRMFDSKPSLDSLWLGRATIQDLWNADIDALIETYPDNIGGFDRSSADQALFTHLAFWTGANCDRIDRLFRRSALCGLSKYLTRPDYQRTSIINAVSINQNVYSDPKAIADLPGQVASEPVTSQPTLPADPPTPQPTINQPEIRLGYQFLTPDIQINYFNNCVYIQDTHRVLIPTGVMLRPDQFKATYGGYIFSLDADGGKETKCPWEAFTASRAVRFKKVQSTVFRPELESGQIINHEGRQVVNTYYPLEIRKIEGDASPFINHVAKLIPDENDRAIIMSYMAACVQHIGTKFQWCPLIQGVEGNGKSLLMRAVAYSVGERFSHFPNAADISNKFNAWIENKLFIGIEEIYTSDKRGAAETLKVMITNDRIEIQRKGHDQYTGDNRANMIMNTNHINAIIKNQNDRRYAPFFTAQQDAEHIKRDGMSGNYFPDLYEWLRGDGYAIVANYLTNYIIPDHLNPATLCHRAPVTTSTALAIETSKGPAEQEIDNAVGENIQGFRGGWISSIALEKLLTEKRKAHFTPPNARSKMLLDMGYIKVGRSPKAMMQEDNKRPTLYMLKGQVAVTSDVIFDYMTAQGYLA